MASATADPPSHLLLLLPRDILLTLAEHVADPLRPRWLGRLCSSCGDVRTALRPRIELLHEQHDAAAVLCAKWKTSCADASTAVKLKWVMCRSELSLADCRSLGNLFGTGALAQLEELEFHSNFVGDQGIQALCDGLSAGSGPRLTNLMLNFNDMGPPAMQAFGAALARGALPALKRLALGNNELGDAGIVALCESLRHGALPALESLLLYATTFGDDGARALAALGGRALPSLRVLQLDHNEMTDAGLDAILEALQRREGGGSLLLPALWNFSCTGNKASDCKRIQTAVLDTLNERRNAMSIG